LLQPETSATYIMENLWVARELLDGTICLIGSYGEVIVLDGNKNLFTVLVGWSTADVFSFDTSDWSEDRMEIFRSIVDLAKIAGNVNEVK
jgi:hypothetical protein